MQSCCYIDFSLRPSQFFRFFLWLWQFSMANCSLSILLDSSVVPQTQHIEKGIWYLPHKTRYFPLVSANLPVSLSSLKPAFLPDLGLQLSSLWIPSSVCLGSLYPVSRDLSLSGLLLFLSSRLCCCYRTVPQPPLSPGFLPPAPLIVFQMAARFVLGLKCFFPPVALRS